MTPFPDSECARLPQRRKVGNWTKILNNKKERGSSRSTGCTQEVCNSFLKVEGNIGQLQLSLVHPVIVVGVPGDTQSLVRVFLDAAAADSVIGGENGHGIAALEMYLAICICYTCTKLCGSLINSHLNQSVASNTSMTKLRAMEHKKTRSS